MVDQRFLRFLLVVFCTALLSIVHLCMHLKAQLGLDCNINFMQLSISKEGFGQK